jgi:hypothetical protein
MAERRLAEVDEHANALANFLRVRYGVPNTLDRSSCHASIGRLGPSIHAFGVVRPG